MSKLGYLLIAICCIPLGILWLLSIVFWNIVNMLIEWWKKDEEEWSVFRKLALGVSPFLIIWFVLYLIGKLHHTNL